MKWIYERTAGIKKSSVVDLAEVLRWLEEEYDEDGGEGFWCNLNVITSCHSEGQLYVLLDVRSDLPIAYIADGRVGPDIVNVKKDRQGEGHGRRLVEFIFELYKNRDDLGAIEIECAPISSIPFWKVMGFTMYSETRGYFALAKLYSLSVNSKTHKVCISFYPEEFLHNSGIEAVFVENCKATRNSENSIGLDKRVLYVSTRRGFDDDFTVTIDVDGRRVYKGKAKNAREYGIRGDSFAWFCDEIVVAKDDILLAEKENINIPL